MNEECFILYFISVLGLPPFLYLLIEIIGDIKKKKEKEEEKRLEKNRRKRERYHAKKREKMVSQQPYKKPLDARIQTITNNSNLSEEMKHKQISWLRNGGK